ncbi:MAG TPA: TlpA disulfide reductase family protein [Pyrinomonadaceae bacterium]|nr:TlpA disulfide reductase family protein [Pyrinomonadaceae bacterium]
MSVESTSSESRTNPQGRLWQRLESASALSEKGDKAEAAVELESALAEARQVPYEIEFQSRIQLAMTLADLYSSLDEIPKAREMLTEESAFAEKISQIMQISGTPSQKRAATGGYLQVRDRAAQMLLLGSEAPEITVKDWIKGGPLSLRSLQGRVVLLEFWATWCKPCQEIFPKLVKLYDQQAANGLEIIALTRHYMAYRGTSEAMDDELQLIRRMIEDHGVNFPVGVVEDEKLQAIYGANGLPTVFLIDRKGLVRYAGPGGEERGFNETLQNCLNES